VRREARPSCEAAAYRVDRHDLARHGDVHVGRRLDGLHAAERVARAVLGTDRRQVHEHNVTQRRGGEVWR